MINVINRKSINVLENQYVDLLVRHIFIKDNWFMLHVCILFGN